MFYRTLPIIIKTKKSNVFLHLNVLSSTIVNFDKQIRKNAIQVFMV